MNTEDQIREKLRKIEALYAGATTPGERDAAEAARERIRLRLAEFEQKEASEEWRFSLENPWSRRLLIGLARRYGLEPYRRYGQRRTSVMIRAPRGFVESTLMPEFNEINEVLMEHLDALATEIIESTLASDTSDPRETRAEIP